MRVLRIIIFVALVLSLVSCRKKLRPQGGWNTEVLAPLMYGEVSLENVVNDSLISVKLDNSISLVYRNVFYSLNFAEEGISVPDTSLTELVTLDSIKLPDRTIVFPFTLGRIAKADQTGFGALILLYEQLQIPVAIPPIDNLQSLNQPLDATDFFETATLDSGYLDIKVENGLPVPIDTLIFLGKNQNDLAVIFIDTFTNIPVGGQATSTHDLAGKTVDGHMLADIVKLSSPGTDTNQIIIDTTDAITLTATVRDLNIISATAVFPAQNLVNQKKEVLYNMGGPEFTTMLIRSGKLIIEALNTVEDSLHLLYAIPGAFDSTGKVILVNSVAPPAPPNGSVSIKDVFDLKGTTIDLTGKDKNTVNTFYNEFSARIDSTGKIISISLTDSILVSYSLVDIIPQYVKGYMGQHTISTGTVTEPFVLFKKITGGTFDLEKTDVVFSVINRMGVEGQMTINTIKAVNEKTGQTRALVSSMIGTPLSMKRAFENPLSFQDITLKLDETNSNIDKVFENMPTKLQYNLDLRINPQGNQFNYQDFVHYDQSLEASLDVEVPLSLTMDHLTLQDTFDFSFTRSGNSKSVTAATLTFLVDNGFPLNALLQVYFTDSKGLPLDSLFASPSAVASGVLDNVSCRVSEDTRTRIQSLFVEARLDNLEAATHVIVRVMFTTTSTPGCAGPLKIYSDYGMSFKLTGRFNYYTGGPS